MFASKLPDAIKAFRALAGEPIVGSTKISIGYGRYDASLTLSSERRTNLSRLCQEMGLMAIPRLSEPFLMVKLGEHHTLGTKSEAYILSCPAGGM